MHFYQKIRNKYQPYWWIYLVNLTDKAIIEGKNTDLLEWWDFLKNGTIKLESRRGLKEAQKLVNFSNLSGRWRTEACRIDEKIWRCILSSHETLTWRRNWTRNWNQTSTRCSTRRKMRDRERVALGEGKGQVMICFKMNLPMEEIQNHTGLKVEEIEAFRKEMKK